MLEKGQTIATLHKLLNSTSENFNFQFNTLLILNVWHADVKSVEKHQDQEICVLFPIALLEGASCPT